MAYDKNGQQEQDSSKLIVSMNCAVLVVSFWKSDDFIFLERPFDVAIIPVDCVEKPVDRAHKYKVVVVGKGLHAMIY